MASSLAVVAVSILIGLGSGDGQVNLVAAATAFGGLAAFTPAVWLVPFHV